MLSKNILSFIILIFLGTSVLFAQKNDDKVINDVTFQFSFKLPAGWQMKDLKQTTDKDAISYSFISKDSNIAVMLLAFRLKSVKNIEDFIYNMEKDISLNIPPKSGDYSEKDFGKYDMKNALYKDSKFDENIYYFRTKLPDAVNNFVYMIRFITETKDYTPEVETVIKSISETFTTTAE